MVLQNRKEKKKTDTINENLEFPSGENCNGGSYLYAAQQQSLLRWNRGEW